MRVLVAFASRHGSTERVAGLVCAGLEQEGIAACVAAVEKAGDLDRHDAAIIGAPILYDRWMGQARDFVAANTPSLVRMPHAFFLTCLTLAYPHSRASAQARGYARTIDRLSPTAPAVEAGRFAGALDYRKLSIWQRPPARLFFGVMGIEEGNHANPAAITAWSRDCARAFLSTGHKEPSE